MDDYKLVFDDFKIKCWLVSDNMPKKLEIEEINKILRSEGIVRGMQNPVLAALKYPYILTEGRTKILVARGKYPQKGESGMIKYIYQQPELTKVKLKTELYQKVSVKVVQKGTQLFAILPPKRGTPGKDVFGDHVQGLLGDHVGIADIAGDGVGKTGEELGRATKTGIYHVDHEGVISIEEEITLLRATFSMEIEKLVVSGDLRRSHVVETFGDLEVRGAIEDAEITVGGDLKCSLGIGKGEKPITVGKKLTAKYINARPDIECGELEVDTSITNSDILVKGRCEVGRITGGRISARDLLRVNELGSGSYLETIVNLGLSEKELFRMHQYKKELIETEKSIIIEDKKLDGLNIKLGRVKKVIGNMVTDGMKKLAEKKILEQHTIATQLKSKDNQLDSLADMYNELETQLKEWVKVKRFYKHRLEVTGRINPGVKITFNESVSYQQEKPETSVGFKLSEDQIVKYDL